MNKQIIVYLYYGILLSNVKEWTTDIYSNVNEFQKKKKLYWSKAIYRNF
jgi:hypothetical protein